MTSANIRNQVVGQPGGSPLVGRRVILIVETGARYAFSPRWEGLETQQLGTVQCFDSTPSQAYKS